MVVLIRTLGGAGLGGVEGGVKVWEESELYEGVHGGCNLESSSSSMLKQLVYFDLIAIFISCFFFALPRKHLFYRFYLTVVMVGFVAHRASTVERQTCPVTEENALPQNGYRPISSRSLVNTHFLVSWKHTHTHMQGLTPTDVSKDEVFIQTHAHFHNIGIHFL